jgi:hypothetical protein
MENNERVLRIQIDEFKYESRKAKGTGGKKCLKLN